MDKARIITQWEFTTSLKEKASNWCKKVIKTTKEIVQVVLLASIGFGVAKIVDSLDQKNLLIELRNTPGWKIEPNPNSIWWYKVVPPDIKTKSNSESEQMPFPRKREIDPAWRNQT